MILTNKSTHPLNRRVNRGQDIGRDERERLRLTGKTTWHLRRSSQSNGVGALPTNTLRRAPRRMEGTPTGSHQGRVHNYETVESIIFVPNTPRGELVKRLQKAEDSISKLQDTPRWKFVETGGNNLLTS